MTDFVDRLLGRLDTPAIRPVVPALFEPVSAPGPEVSAPADGPAGSAPRVTMERAPGPRRNGVASAPEPVRVPVESTRAEPPVAVPAIAAAAPAVGSAPVAAPAV
ncbi:MAG TPA: hypothetical protein VGX25_18385, partial [Actinophytocola sp.]|nr:hypothetical protein [Actinophytocola sp.]